MGKKFHTCSLSMLQILVSPKTKIKGFFLFKSRNPNPKPCHTLLTTSSQLKNPLSHWLNKPFIACIGKPNLL